MTLREKINLVHLSKEEIEALKAGYAIDCGDEHCCGCGCFYAESGGSSTSANRSANYDDDLYSPIT